MTPHTEPDTVLAKQDKFELLRVFRIVSLIGARTTLPTKPAVRLGRTSDQVDAGRLPEKLPEGERVALLGVNRPMVELFDSCIGEHLSVVDGS